MIGICFLGDTTLRYISPGLCSYEICQHHGVTGTGPSLFMPLLLGKADLGVFQVLEKEDIVSYTVFLL